MKVLERGVREGSHIYFHTPSPMAKKLLYYPIAAGTFFCDAAYNVERLRYDSLLALYVIEGEMQLEQGDVRLQAEAGELLLVNCYEPHRYFTAHTAKTLWVHFDGADSRAWFDEIKAEKGQQIKDCGRLLPVLRDLLAHIQNSKNEYLISNCLYSLLLSMHTTEQEAQNNLLNHIGEVKQYMKAHLCEELTVHLLAQVAHLSPSYFSKLFRELTGFSPYEYLLNLRLEKAKELLYKTNLSVSQIAYQTGFNSDANFIYFFKKETGLSPLKFRKIRF